MNDDDGIRLGKCERPQLRIKDHPCARCGNPILAVGNLCIACMNRGFRKEVMAHQAVILGEQPAALLGTALDQLGRRHVAVIGHHDLSFCGIRLTEAKKKRLQARADDLPKGTCELCRDLVNKARKGDSK